MSLTEAAPLSIKGIPKQENPATISGRLFDNGPALLRKLREEISTTQQVDPFTELYGALAVTCAWESQAFEVTVEPTKKQGKPYPDVNINITSQSAMEKYLAASTALEQKTLETKALVSSFDLLHISTLRTYRQINLGSRVIQLSKYYGTSANPKSFLDLFIPTERISDLRVRGYQSTQQVMGRRWTQVGRMIDLQVRTAADKPTYTFKATKRPAPGEPREPTMIPHESEGGWFSLPLPLVKLELLSV